MAPHILPFRTRLHNTCVADTVVDFVVPLGDSVVAVLMLRSTAMSDRSVSAVDSFVAAVDSFAASMLRPATDCDTSAVDSFVAAVGSFAASISVSMADSVVDIVAYMAI